MPDFAQPRGILSPLKTKFEAYLELGERMFPKVNLPSHAVAAITKTGRWGQRTGKIDPLMVTWTLLTMALRRDLSIDQAFELCLSWREGGREVLEKEEVTLNAIHHARQRLGWEPMAALLASLGDSCPSYIDPKIGMRVLALDSSKINLPDTEANAEEFGRATTANGESQYPQLMVSLLVSVYDRIVRHAVILPGNSDEHKGAFAFVDYLNSYDLLLIDRGIPSIRLLKTLLDKRVAFAVRIPSNWGVTVVRTFGEGDHLVTLTREVVNEGKRETLVVQARLIEFQVGDEAVRILTTLTDAKQVPAQAFVDLYHECWQIETAIGEMKNTIAAPKRGRSPLLVRSESPNLVRQELYAMLALHVLIRNEGRRAAEYQNLQPNTLSFTRWFNRIQRLINEGTPGHTRRITLGAKSCKLERRRRTGRTYPRQTRQYQPKHPRRDKNYGQTFRTLSPKFATTERTKRGINTS